MRKCSGLIHHLCLVKKIAVFLSSKYLLSNHCLTRQLQLLFTGNTTDVEAEIDLDCIRSTQVVAGLSIDGRFQVQYNTIVHRGWIRLNSSALMHSGMVTRMGDNTTDSGATQDAC